MIWFYFRLINSIDSVYDELNSIVWVCAYVVFAFINIFIAFEKSWIQKIMKKSDINLEIINHCGDDSLLFHNWFERFLFEMEGRSQKNLFLFLIFEILDSVQMLICKVFKISVSWKFQKPSLLSYLLILSCAHLYQKTRLIFPHFVRIKSKCDFRLTHDLIS